MNKDDIIVRNAIIHIVDSKKAEPKLSDELLDLGPDLNDFIRSHIYKIASCDEAKNCRFTKDSEVEPIMLNFSENTMIPDTQKLAKHLHSIMNANIDIPAADLLVATYQAEGVKYLALLKLNYKEVFSHVSGKGNGQANDVVKQNSLPASSTRLKEAALINLESGEIELVEKKYEVNGVKTNYFSKLFLGCDTEASEKAKYNALSKTIKKVNQKFFEDDFEKQMEIKSMLQSQMLEEGEIFVPELAEKIYADNKNAKDEFIQIMEKQEMDKETVQPKNQASVKKLEKQFLVTEDGIEINIPMESYNSKDKVAFLTNPDGTISVLIKNVQKLDVQ